jgi:hypothetical protein
MNPETVAHWKTTAGNDGTSMDIFLPVTDIYITINHFAWLQPPAVFVCGIDI